ncbi:allantoate amidohydrolase [Pseudarthrobacter sp. J75]|uniref:allantoate amidohydrolase n=1 Tax=unclassified Pseudarthrobacter TaxID=2647000 RepID=UPI002E8233BB|nr:MULTISPECIES: allantoate amidohydrolase [unclassified Pseudarthrobacter]MEE2524129.1 allantoate amidohydrolase [Pseudarthrobacter sp. J47]MEE2530408.1 allantoate amidohydrolase [Pseudarthrobacter sp. J75]
MTAPSTTATVTSLLAEIADVGTDQWRGGYSRPVFSTAETDLRGWFVEQAGRRGLDVETDRNGIIWAWWDTASRVRKDAVLTGSHLDSVPGGGGFDGPLGVASALVAVDILKARGLEPAKPLAVAVFPEEEGSRFGVACLGSRLLTGALDPDKARNLRDADGNTYAEVAAAGGQDPRFIGADPAALAQLGLFVELHVEQGRGLIDLERPVAIGSSILGHGRWKLSFAGQGNHAGTTLMAGRRDPMVAAARAVVAIRDAAREHRNVRATVGRLQPVPGGTNVIASRVDLWIDVRHPDDAVTAAVVESITCRAELLAAEEGCTAALTVESLSPTVHFDAGLRDTLQLLLPDAPVLETGAGHDAGVLAGHLPTAMLFVRNPTGISHSPEELVDDADAELGAVALADALAGLLIGPDA